MLAKSTTDSSSPHINWPYLSVWLLYLTALAFVGLYCCRRTEKDYKGFDTPAEELRVRVERNGGLAQPLVIVQSPERRAVAQEQ